MDEAYSMHGINEIFI